MILNALYNFKSEENFAIILRNLSNYVTVNILYFLDSKVIITQLVISTINKEGFYGYVKNLSKYAIINIRSVLYSLLL